MGKAGLLKKLHPLLVLTTIWAISDEQPPSVRYTRGYAELPTALHTFRTDNEASRVARIFRQEDHCSLPSRLSLCSQKDSKDDKCIGVIKRTLPLQKYEVRIHFYIHFTIAGSHARCPTISGNGKPTYSLSHHLSTTSSQTARLYLRLLKGIAT